MGNIPLRAADRPGLEHIVFAGGACTYNAEPLAPFFDFFSLGEGERSTEEILECYRAAKKNGLSKDEFLREVARIDGVYVPSFYEHSYNDDGTPARSFRRRALLRPCRNASSSRLTTRFTPRTSSFRTPRSSMTA